jgi:hypothetical protein
VVDIGGQEVLVVVIETVDKQEGSEVTLQFPTDKCAVIA